MDICVSDEPAYSIERYSDYLSLSKEGSDYYEKIHGLVKDLGFSDFSLAEFDSNVNVIRHVQTIPEEMYISAYNPNDHDLVGLHATKCPGKPIYLSDLEDAIKDNKSMEDLFSGYLNTYEVIKKFGYSDYYNIPIQSNSNSTLLLSLSNYDIPIDTFKQSIAEKNEALNCLIMAIKRSIPNTSRLQDSLTEREIEILELLSNSDKPLSAIAKHLSIEESTVRYHLKSARERTGISKTHFLIAQSLRDKIIK